MRTPLSRDFYIPLSHIKITAKHCSAVVYIDRRYAGPWYAMGFSGKSQKPAWNYRFSRKDRLHQKIADYFKQVERIEKEQAARAQERRDKLAIPHDLQVGDVLLTSWGYEQTNIEYFQVTRLIGKRTVEIREIAQDTTTTDWARGQCVPVPNQFIGDPLKRRVNEQNRVKIRSWGCYAQKADYKEVEGVKVYRSRYWSSYA